MWWFDVKAVCADMKGTTSWKITPWKLYWILTSRLKRKSDLNSVLSVLCARTYVPIGEGGDVCEDQINDRKTRYSDRAGHHWIHRYAVRGNCLCVSMRVCMRVSVCVKDVFGCNYECVETHFTTLSSCSPLHTPNPTPTWSLTPSVSFSSFIPSFIHSFSPSLLQVRTIKAGSLQWAGEGRILRPR